MRLTEFSHGDSFIHLMDPRSKIVTTVIFSVFVAVNNSLQVCALALIFPLAMLGLGRISFSKTLRRLAAINSFLVILWLLLPFSYPGDPLFAIGSWTATRQGALMALMITLKSNAIVLTMMALLGSSSIFSLAHALTHLGVPEKIALLFFFSYRYIHVINTEFETLSRAMKIRSFRPNMNIHTYRSYAYLVGMLLVKSFDRSNRIMAAMKCRGFKGKFYILHHYQMKRMDFLLPAVSGIFAVLIMVVR